MGNPDCFGRAVARRYRKGMLSIYPEQGPAVNAGLPAKANCPIGTTDTFDSEEPLDKILIIIII
jgi:hypothetical protein